MHIVVIYMFSDINDGEEIIVSVAWMENYRRLRRLIWIFFFFFHNVLVDIRILNKFITFQMISKYLKTTLSRC